MPFSISYVMSKQSNLGHAKKSKKLNNVASLKIPNQINNGAVVYWWLNM